MLAFASMATRAIPGLSQYGTAERNESTGSRKARSAAGSATSTWCAVQIDVPSRPLTRSAARCAAARSASANRTSFASPNFAMSYPAAVPCRPDPTTANV